MSLKLCFIIEIQYIYIYCILTLYLYIMQPCSCLEYCFMYITVHFDEKRFMNRERLLIMDEKM